MEVVSPLSGWESFYVIMGGAAAALTGLQFVVLVLSAEVNVIGNDTTTNAYATPTIVHFCAVLFISAVLSVPWPALAGAALALAACGVAGFVYAIIVLRRAQRQTDYEPVLEDWIWHNALPLIGYAALFIAGLILQGQTVLSLFLSGGVAMLLLFVSIHNAWDSVVFIALQRRQRQEGRGSDQQAPVTPSSAGSSVEEA
ncbi:MAG TPA: hypothetical protein VFU22_31635 [Roseiflexaceae bacterium]|nr:hypothetical protein [Roseiflexaceae bacterium]